MSELHFTPEQEAAIAASIMENKPYLIELEQIVQDVQFGEINLTITVRGGSVEKMGFHSEKIWMKDKHSNKNVDLIQKTGSI